MRAILSLEATSKVIFQRYLSSAPILSALTTQRQIKIRERRDHESSKRLAVEAFLLAQKKQLSVADWKAVAEENGLNLTNVGNIVMSCLLEKKDPALHPHAEDFVAKFTSVSVLSRYILLQKTEEPVLALYEKIKTLVKGIWSVEIAERIAIALSRTSKWRDISDIIESVKIGGNPSNATYSAYAKAAFLNGDFHLGWKITAKLKNSSEVMEAFIQKCPEVPGKEEEEGARVFKQFVDQEMEMSLVRKLFEFYTKLGYDCKLSERIWKSPAAYCSNCKREIKEQLTSEEFSSLKTTFYEKVMQGKDVYMNSTPVEMQQFLRFCEERGPFEIVLDGLNAGMNPKGNTILPRMIQAFQSHKVLVIGRKHMDKQWKWLQMKLRGQPVEFYFLNDDSQDDIFMLYACFTSGPNTKVVTRDMLRDHLFKLGDTEGPTFRKWLRLNQLNVEVMGKSRKVRIFGNGGRFLQWEKGFGGHIPVKIESNSDVRERDVREVWACFQKK